MRDLPAIADGKDNEGLADARIQALYQITRDDALLKPFYDRLASEDERQRESGVMAFRFLKLQTAPAQLVNCLQDVNPRVRCSTMFVLGEISDPNSAESVMTVAGNLKEEPGVRQIAIGFLGRMKTTAATELLEKFLTDPNPGIQTNAAIALYRITGKKAKQFPEGYSTEKPTEKQDASNPEASRR